MAKRGRKTKYTPERVEKILQLLASGSTRKAAAESNGISQETFSEWITKKLDFLDDVKKAEAQAESAMALIIQKAARGYKVLKTKTVNRDGVITLETVETHEFSWQAAAWWLERRRKDDYGLAVKSDEQKSDGLSNFVEALKAARVKRGE